MSSSLGAGFWGLYRASRWVHLQVVGLGERLLQTTLKVALNIPQWFRKVISPDEEFGRVEVVLLELVSDWRAARRI